MDEKSVREQLDEVQRELKRNEEEHEVLVSLVRGLEGWLRLHSPRPIQPSAQPSLSFELRRNMGQTRISLTDAILRVVRDARGEPLHAKEIVTRAVSMGAAVSAKYPHSVVDTILISKLNTWPVERMGNRMWRYAGRVTGQQDDVDKQEVLPEETQSATS